MALFRYHIFLIFVVVPFISNSFLVYGNTTDNYVSSNPIRSGFPLVSNGKIGSVLISDNDHQGVLRVSKQLISDLYEVSNLKCLDFDLKHSNRDNVIIIGTLGHSKIIDKLVATGKLDSRGLKGKREKFHIQIIKNPIKGIKQALVITGSDKRGTIYGMYDLSEKIGVSPWHYWADVPAKKQAEIYIKPGLHTNGEPKVKYRGIFINDEAPALSSWANTTFGGFNASFYNKVFELILRLKGNYLWPAMWGKMFYVDDVENSKLANEYGIVVGTSHHEPMGRAHAEWKKFGNGKWDFTTNQKELTHFWEEGVKRFGNTEAIITIGMRGDGDEPMKEGTAISLLENIVKTQRKLISQITKKEISKVPQVWALYKEVQDYFDKGMRVPEDVTLLFCDDNWGNIRKLPPSNSKPRQGGYGMYYHFDYVGGPRNYKWINTNQIERIWEQMNLAYQNGVGEIWIANVGDIKPMELPTSFFLEMAWNPEKYNAKNLDIFYSKWANQNFGSEFESEITRILKLYTKYNSRRKPEMLSSETYSITHYNEAEIVVADYNMLVNTVNKVNNTLNPKYKDAFYQLVMHPVISSANLNEMYFAAAKNALYAQQGRVATNHWAKEVKHLFEKDSLITSYYHTKIANGKWNNMMAQTHIGYTNWQEPPKNCIPKTQQISCSTQAQAAIAIEGSELFWVDTSNNIVLPTFTSFEKTKKYLEIFNRGISEFDYKIEAANNWILFSKKEGTISQEERIYIEIDWDNLPKNTTTSSFTIQANHKEFLITLNIDNPNIVNAKGFIESKGYIAFEAPNYSNKTEQKEAKWVVIDNLSRTSSGISLQPARIVATENKSKLPTLEYDLFFRTNGKLKVHAYFSPSLNFTSQKSLQYAIGFDNQPPQIVNYNANDSDKNWNLEVANNCKIITTDFYLTDKGNHILKFYGINSGLVLQKIVIETETSNLQKSYLGPMESFKK